MAENYWLLILQCFYFMLPAYFANMAPVIVKKINILNLQIDFNKGDAEYLTTTSAGIRRSYLIQGYWNQAEEEFKQLNEM